MTSDSLSDIERDVLAVVRRAYEAGVAEGKRVTLASFVQFANSALPVEASPALVSLGAKFTRQRAPHGHVQQAVTQVIEAHPDGIAQSDIVSAGARAGLEIKPSSMRMALPVLEKTGVIESRDGKWFPRGNGTP